MPPSCTAQVGPTLRTGRDGRRKRQRKGRNQSGKTRNKRERLATSARRDDVRSRYERNPQARAKNIRHSLGVYCTMHTKVFTVYETAPGNLHDSQFIGLTPDLFSSLSHPFCTTLQALAGAIHWLLVAFLPSKVFGLFRFQPRLVYPVS